MSLYFNGLDEKWRQIIEEESKKNYFLKLLKFIEIERQSKEVFPPKNDTFNAFKYTPFNEVKVVILGQDPYHNNNQAHGLSFSVNDGMKIPPSLRNIFKELENDLGIKHSVSGDLTKWAKQGVLLLNTILTVEAHKPLSHKNIGWEIFTNKVINCLNEDDSPKVFILWGNNAIKKSDLITNSNHLIIATSHPSPLSARHSFFGSRLFTKTNDFLRSSQLKEIDFN